ncbi:MAG: hypothetical protein [Caudoviricetes sp.]|nr:MAG: hypothetical protein [Caudoviricetes sp.]
MNVEQSSFTNQVTQICRLEVTLCIQLTSGLTQLEQNGVVLQRPATIVITLFTQAVRLTNHLTNTSDTEFVVQQTTERQFFTTTFFIEELTFVHQSVREVNGDCYATLRLNFPTLVQGRNLLVIRQSFEVFSAFTTSCFSFNFSTLFVSTFPLHLGVVLSLQTQIDNTGNNTDHRFRFIGTTDSFYYVFGKCIKVYVGAFTVTSVGRGASVECEFFSHVF